MYKLDLLKLIISIVVLVGFTWPNSAQADQCEPDGYKYGESELVDQLMVCSIAKLQDLDLTPQSEYVKNTLKVLIEQGLSDKTTILHAKLSGLWSGRQADFVKSGWNCEAKKITVTSLIQLNGLSLEVVEKVEIPLHRNQQKLAIHKPCKTFDLPLWMCRQSKPIYRTTKTWVNRAYFNLTLSQALGASKPSIEKLTLMFTCPETFKQKITYSPSAVYILSKYLQAVDSDISQYSTSPTSYDGMAQSSLAHPVMFTSTQDGKEPATPPYHNSVNLIMNQVSESLKTSLNDCIHLTDIDLSLMADHNSFTKHKFKTNDDSDKNVPVPSVSISSSNYNECSNKHWLRNRLETVIEASTLNSEDEQQRSDLEGHSKRSQFLLKYPVDPNQLLNPHGYYHDNKDLMIEDE